MVNKLILLLTIFLILPYIAHSITTFVVQETEKVSLEPKVIDLDADKLTITYTTPLNEKGEWQTTYGDAGEYKAVITVSDSVANVSEDVLIVVKKKEEPPLIESFSPRKDNLNIKEADAINFKISASDLNKDNLSYEWFLDDKKVKDSQEFYYETTYKDAGEHKVSMAISDGKTSVKKEWNIVVSDVDREPVFEKIENKVINEGEELKISLNANDSDGEEITYSANNLPDGTKLEGNAFVWKTDYDTVKKESIVDKVIDKFRGLSKSFYVQFIAVSKDKKIVQNIIITVKDINRAPVLEDMEPITINEGETIQIVPKVYDLDRDKVSLSYSGFMDSNTFKSSYDDAGTYYVKVTASDGLLETLKFVQINLKQSNRVPLFEKIEDIKANEGDNIAVLLKANELDGDEIKFSIDNPPEGSSLKGNVFFWTPSWNLAIKKETKKFDLVFVANDGKAETRQIAKVEINDKNRAPKIIDATKSISAKVNEPVLMFIKAVDEDGDELTYTWDFGILEKYKATATHQRIFTSRGTKVVKVMVSDGVDEVEQLINVNVV